jgi:hypothetical protein
VHNDRIGLRLRPLDPERPEHRKFFAFRRSGIDRQSPCRKSVTLALRNRPEIACAEEDRDLIKVIGTVDRIMQSKPGKADVSIRFRRLDVAEGEHAGRIRDTSRMTLVNLEDVNTVGVVESAMEELNLERQVIGTPPGVLRQEPDRPVLIVVHVFEFRRQPGVTSMIGLLGKVVGELPHGQIVECRARVSLCSVRLCGCSIGQSCGKLQKWG